MDIRARVSELARIEGASSPVLSVYLNTRWADEHQRERVRVFLKNEIRKARRATLAKEIAEELDWVRSEGESLIEQSRFPEASGVALFACRALGLREVLPVRAPFEDTFVIADAPFLRPLVALADETPSTLVVFLDTESARLIPLTARGAGEEVALESEVPGHHRRGGWAQLAQSRYQRHIQNHRGRHFDAVVEALSQLGGESQAERIIMAGEPRTVSAFTKHLPEAITGRIVGIVLASRYEAAGAIVARASEFLARVEEQEKAVAVDAVLTEAAKSGQAVAGLEETLEAVARGAVQYLYLVKGFREPGRVCAECGALQRGEGPACRLCGRATKAVELGEAMVDRVIGTGGKAEFIGIHARLSGVGGVAARLRYPL